MSKLSISFCKELGRWTAGPVKTSNGNWYLLADTQEEMQHRIEHTRKHGEPPRRDMT